MNQLDKAKSVGELMTRDLVVIRAEAPLTEAARLLDEHRIHGLPVVDEAGVLVGVVSQTDMVRARTTQGLWASWPGLKVKHLMTSPALTIAADAGMPEAAMLMEGNHVHRLVVVGDNGKPVGIVSTTDLLRAIVGEVEA